MKTPVEVLLAVDSGGGKLGITGDRLRMLLPIDCPLELKEAIREHKLALLDLLRLNFLIIRSDALKSIIYWTPDAEAKESLIAAGADGGSIYSAPELAHIVRNRITTEELLVIHEAKKGFQGKVTEP